MGYCQQSASKLKGYNVAKATHLNHSLRGAKSAAARRFPNSQMET